MKLSRRQFTAGTAGVGLAALGGSGLGLLGPSLTAQAEVESSDPEVTRFTGQDPAISYLGQPVNSQIGARAPRIGREDGRWVEYQVYKGSANTDLPGTFVITDIGSGEVVRSIKLPTAEACFDLTVASDGKVYLPSYYDYHLWQYDPATKQINDLGPINTDATRDHAFGAGAGPDGMVFLGTYSDSRLYRYEPATGQIRNLGSIDPEQDYIHFISWDPGTNAVFCAVGGREASIWRIEDAGLGARTRIVDSSKVSGFATAFLGTMDCVHGHLVARVGGSLVVTDLDGNVEYYTGDREIAAYHAVPTRDGSGFFFSAFGEVQKYDFATHSYSPTAANVRSYIAHGVEIDYNRIAGTDAGGVFVVNYLTGARLEYEPSFHQPTLIQKIFPGPDDTMWASGYMKGLAKIDTDGGEPNDTLDFGQFESWIVRDGLMYLGWYGHSKFGRFDPAKPLTNPTQLFTSAGVNQDRPFAMTYNPDRDEVYMGSVPGYGSYQGGLAVYEFATGKVIHLLEQVVTNQSIISAVYNPHDKLVYLGTTIDGGMGNDPTSVTTEGQLVVFDPATRMVVRRSVPVAGREGVTGLLVDPDGSVWGVAEEQLIKVAPSGSVQVFGAVSNRYAGPPAYTWARAYLNWSAMDGQIYGSAGGFLFRIDPATGAITRLADGGATWAATDGTGDVYFAYRTHLFKYTVPVLLSGPPNDAQKCSAVNAYASGRSVRFAEGYPQEWKDIFHRINQRVAAGETDAQRQEFCEI